MINTKGSRNKLLEEITHEIITNKIFTVKELSSKLRLSEGYLRLFFKKMMQITLGTYIIEVRMNMYPVSNQFRNTISLSGIWDFRFQGDPSWVSVYVPASYNNQVNDPRARYYTGIVEYKTRFTIPRSWEDQRISLRFDAVTHDAEVFLDGSLVGKHKGGFLPFEIDLTSIVGCGTAHAPYPLEHIKNVIGKEGDT